MDAISEQRLALVFPELAARVRKMSDTLALLGIEIRVVQGLRTVAEQDALYNQGRTTPGKIVTNCRGGRSYHNLGLAVDCVPSTHGPDMPYDPDWDSGHPVWKQMEAIGADLGLTVGALWRTFPDAPHFQLTGQYPVGKPTDELSAILNTGGLQSVWDSVALSKETE